MKKFEGFALVSVNAYNQGNEDKNGKMPVFLNVLAGKAPNRVVLSGTVAENAGFEVGNTYLAQCRELEPDEEHGRQFSWNVIEKTEGALNIIKARKELGNAQVFDAKLAEVEQGQETPVNNNVN